MNLKNLVVVVLRIIAITFALRIVSRPLFDLFNSLPRIYHAASINLWGLAITLILIVVFLACACAIWGLAFRIAELATRGMPADVSFGTLSLADCYSIAFIGIGLFQMVVSLPDVVVWSVYEFKSAISNINLLPQQDIPLFILRPFGLFIVGLLLFINGRQWAVALARRHNDGPPSPSSPTE